MNSVFVAVFLLASLGIVALLGQALRRRLPEHHLSADSRDAVKLAMGLVATMTALLPGLLAFSAKGTYDTRRTEIIEMAAKVNLLDHVLTAYGPDAADARARLREAIAECIRYTWSDEAGAQAIMAPIWQANVRFHSAVLGLSPHDDPQRELKARAVTLVAEIGQLRMLLLIQKAPSIAKPLLIAVSCWLAVIFLSFGLLAPSNATTTVALLAAAAAVASSVLLIMELDRPLGGLIRVSIQPMVDALNLSIDPDVPNTAAGS